MFKRAVFIVAILFYTSSSAQFISLEACNETSSIAARNTCLKNYVESLLLNAFEKNKRIIKQGNNLDKLTLKVSIGEAGIFEIIDLKVKNIALYTTTKKVIDKLLPISIYKNFEGIPLYDSFEIEIDFPLKEEITTLKDKKIYTLQDVEKSPVFPGCYSDNNSTLRNCMSQNIQRHIANNFNVFINPKSRVKKGKQRINVQFIINKNGFIGDIKVKAKYKELENEAERVIKALPKMTPGKYQNEAVDVLILLPISFNLN